jgi:hypothetical protein
MFFSEWEKEGRRKAIGSKVSQGPENWGQWKQCVQTFPKLIGTGNRDKRKEWNSCLYLHPHTRIDPRFFPFLEHPDNNNMSHNEFGTDVAAHTDVPTQQQQNRTHCLRDTAIKRILREQFVKEWEKQRKSG